MNTSLLWVDWRLSPRELRRETAGRLLLLTGLALGLLILQLSGGADRLLSARWAITAVLRPSVPDMEGMGIAGKVAALPAVGSAVYRDPEFAWREFLAAYPGLQSLRAEGGNPVPGYVEIRLRRERLTEADAASVVSALQPLPQVEKVLAGGESLSRLLRLKSWVNGACLSGFGLLCAVLFALFVSQEKARACRQARDFAFLESRGISARTMAWKRAAGAAVSGGVLSLGALSAAAGAVFLLSGRLPAWRLAVGPAEDLASPSALVPMGAFLLLAVLLSAAASLAGWRAALSPRP